MKLNSIRMMVVIATLAGSAAVPVFQYWRPLIPMVASLDYVFYGIAALFAGVCFAGGILFLALLVLRGKLPAWLKQPA